MFVEKLQLTGKAYTADEMARASYNKLQMQKTGLFRIIKMQPHTVVLDEKEVPNTVSINRVAAAPGRRKNHPKAVQRLGLRRSETNTTQQQPKKGTSLSVSKDPMSPSEYAEDSIVAHKRYGQNRHYIVRCNGYGFEDDTL